jgi:hypothetical protein
MNWRSEGVYVLIVPETLFRELSSEEDSSFATILFPVLYSSVGTNSGWGILAEKRLRRGILTIRSGKVACLSIQARQSASYQTPLPVLLMQDHELAAAPQKR